MADRIALVTGAGVRVGEAIARALAKDGWTVAAHYRTHRPRGFASALQADLAAADGPAQLAAAFRARHRRLDLLVNSASVFDALPLAGTDAAAFDSQMDLNARAPLLLVRALAPLLARARGSVVNVIDVGGGLVPWKGYAAYAASKAALARLTECLALELAPRVRVNGVAPGTVLWPERYPAAQRRGLTARIPLRRPGTPEDVAAAVRYLADAPFVTGAVLPVDGGRHLSGRAG
ncbi:short-chain dehydrogenase/reductase SDR [Anaeromyxobacter dehalogenans 2CP-1]|uniref:Short-chain dehydrogenase/reductase SDR n=1 Tax=Anaeromyxobacter dehalogenans (strain ATCC BAA-258 / DSM 21875 / 2CP-1) TaxID=455488 RepID=B8J664_ANAD2|nr:SDR family oxidoreductase [Anaeromyxobacter dehalogenans]ACL66959.1 short-chain dehydrogenase/reductase SDR [Anaeromyxobacter dehalogenans 2CP-1]